MRKLAGSLSQRALIWLGQAGEAAARAMPAGGGGTVHGVMDMSGLEFEQQRARDVLIIEDEPFISVDLLEIVEALGHNVIGVARTKDDAEAVCRDHVPELIISDIQLADGSSGIDTVNALLRDRRVPAIFISAHLDELNENNRPSPVLTISKPFKPSVIRDAINQVLAFQLDAAPAPECVV